MQAVRTGGVQGMRAFLCMSFFSLLRVFCFPPSLVGAYVRFFWVVAMVVVVCVGDGVVR